MVENLKPGDVVRLRSGGPTMTILEKQGQNSADCAWFVGGDMKTGSFPLVALKPAEPDDELRAAGIGS